LLAETIQRFETPTGEVALTVNEAICAAASSQGAAHYDEEVRLDLEVLAAQVMMNSTALDRKLVEVGEVTLALGHFVLDALKTE
jgi:hypothetical protein